MIRWTGLPPQVLMLGAVLAASMAYGADLLKTKDHDSVVNLILTQCAVYALVVFIMWRTGKNLDRTAARRALLVILGAAAAMRLLLLFMPPVSTDIYRYVWDGRVQAANVNPYRYVPADPALAALRDEAIYPQINRKEYAPTIYPPMAQAVFYVATRVSESVTMMKVAMLAFEILTIWALLHLLATHGLPLASILIYAWHPLPVWEIAGSGHIDAVAIALMLLAFVAAERRSPLLAGIALGAGAAAKFVPIIVGPALYQRWDWKLPAAFLVTVALLYGLYASAGANILGFAGGYADEERLRTGEGFYLFALLHQTLGAPSAALPVFLGIGMAILSALAVRSVFTAPRNLDLKSAFLLMATFTAIISPHHAWYLTWLVPFLCFYQSMAALYVTCAAVLLYRLGWPPDVARASILYGPFILLLLWDFFRYTTAKEAHDDSAITTAIR